MNLTELSAITSPLAVVVGMLFTAYWTSRKRNEATVLANANRDATDKGIAAELKTVTEAAVKADEHLAKSIEKLGERLEDAIHEFKLSNERHAKHEVDCAEFRGATVKALEQLADSARISNSVRERLAVHDERLEKLDEAIEWGTRRFEELFRGQAALSRGATPPPSAMDEPAPHQPQRRTPHRRGT
jgi:hypothetical protein